MSASVQSDAMFLTRIAATGSSGTGVKKGLRRSTGRLQGDKDISYKLPINQNVNPSHSHWVASHIRLAIWIVLWVEAVPPSRTEAVALERSVTSEGI